MIVFFLSEEILMKRKNKIKLKFTKFCLHTLIDLENSLLTIHKANVYIN